MVDSLDATFQEAGFALIETHISRVYLSEHDVYKTKRCVDLGFLDFTTLEARKRACEAEVELNRRLAPDVYLGVVAVLLDAKGQLVLKPTEDVTSEAVMEWAVHMRRLRDEERADLLLARGALQRTELEQIAGLLAQFHAAARADECTAAFGSPPVIARNVEENFTQVQATISEYLNADESALLMRRQRTCMEHESALFEQRARDGFVRDGHGDLRLEHLYRTPRGFVAIDCIEFNDRFRYGDVCADLAFLAMDLAYHGRLDLAELLIAAYARESRDYGLYALIDFYQSYRAFVRAKVASMLAHDPKVSAATREHAQSETRRYYLLALSATERQHTKPRIIVSFGLIASGKSKLASGLSERLGVAVLSADRTRKELLGVAPTQNVGERAFDGAYAPEATERVYATLYARARDVLKSGRHVVIDATFRKRQHRDQVRALATEVGADITLFECRCPRELTIQRLQRRAQGPSVSDARLELLDTFSASFEAAAELPASDYALIDTSQPVAQSLATALAKLGVVPSNPTVQAAQSPLQKP